MPPKGFDDFSTDEDEPVIAPSRSSVAKPRAAASVATPRAAPVVPKRQFELFALENNFIQHHHASAVFVFEDKKDWGAWKVAGKEDDSGLEAVRLLVGEAEITKQGGWEVWCKKQRAFLKEHSILSNQTRDSVTFLDAGDIATLLLREYKLVPIVLQLQFAPTPTNEEKSFSERVVDLVPESQTIKYFIDTCNVGACLFQYYITAAKAPAHITNKVLLSTTVAGLARKSIETNTQRAKLLQEHIKMVNMSFEALDIFNLNYLAIQRFKAEQLVAVESLDYVNNTFTKLF
jgi:hypothetical protein